MTEFNIRTDSVDVEQIMRQIRARIQEKRGVDYTEQQIQELANVKLERFLDPKGVRSDLVEQFKRTRGTSPEPPNYGFEDTTLYETHRGIVRLIRKILNPILKLFFNPNPIVHVLHLQGQINNINAQQFRVREELDALYYEVIHNLVLEVTRLGIESKSMKMRLESLASRMDFDERRTRALEGVVQYKPGTGPARELQPQATVSRAAEPPRAPRREQRTRPQVEAAQAPSGAAAVEATSGVAAEGTGGEDAAGSSTARRRRRRRRGRRGGRGRGADAMALDGVPAIASESDGLTTDAAAAGPQNELYDTESNGGGSDSDADEGPEPADQ